MSTATTTHHRHVPWIASAAVAAVIAAAGVVSLVTGGVGGSDQTPAPHAPAQLDFLRAAPFDGNPGYVRFGDLPRTGHHLNSDTMTARRGGTPLLGL